MEFLNKYSDKINKALPLGAKKEIAKKVGCAPTFVSNVLANKVDISTTYAKASTIKSIIELAIEIIKRSDNIRNEVIEAYELEYN